MRSRHPGTFTAPSGPPSPIVFPGFILFVALHSWNLLFGNDEQLYADGHARYTGVTGVWRCLSVLHCSKRFVSLPQQLTNRTMVNHSSCARVLSRCATVRLLFTTLSSEFETHVRSKSVLIPKRYQPTLATPWKVLKHVSPHFCCRHFPGDRPTTILLCPIDKCMARAMNVFRSRPP